MKEFVRDTLFPRVYLVGRNEEAAEAVIAECKELNQGGKVQFLKADVSTLAEVDRVCAEITKKESHINLLVQTQSNIDLKGRNGELVTYSPNHSSSQTNMQTETTEGLDRKFTLNFYSRMRFISNLLPLLNASSEMAPHYSRSISVLGAGYEEKIDFSDLDLKNTFSPRKCAAHTIVMNDIMAEEFSIRQPGTTFIHSSPLAVYTELGRDAPLWARVLAKGFAFVFSPFFVSAKETGERHTFLATSALYPPRKPFEIGPLSKGIIVPGGSKTVMPGADGKDGSGAYLVNWNNEITGREKLLQDYRDTGTGRVIWEHTMGIFEQVEKLRQERVAGKTLNSQL